ncbi:PDC sensor domain-containing protein [Neomoorella humiferrea]|uniref:PDC sensor domain-containing protein n=1 Tax=Neomoorella humiferrea TaxID=676965 RepID=UPI0030D22295
MWKRFTPTAATVPYIFSQPPAALANARIRPWWQRAMAGEEYISTVYVSAITRQPCRTQSLPIRDGSGRIVGVLAAEQRSKPATLEQMGY